MRPTDKSKKTVPGKAVTSQKKAQTNGSPAKKIRNVQKKGKKDLPSGPKKAKIAKMDGGTRKGAEGKKSKGKAVGETIASEVGKKEGSRFEKKGEKKRMSPMMKKNRLGKNKFKKLKKLLQQEEAE